jgi:hypothetical protein
MSEAPFNDADDGDDLPLIQESIRQARRTAIEQRAFRQRKIPLWRDGQVVWVDAAMILCELDRSRE